MDPIAKRWPWPLGFGDNPRPQGVVFTAACLRDALRQYPTEPVLLAARQRPADALHHLHGELDAIAPLASARMLAARIPDAELKVVSGAGHAYALERPVESFQLLCEWLECREPIAPGRPRTGPLAAAEPLTQALGLPVGIARTGLSLAELARGRR